MEIIKRSATLAVIVATLFASCAAASETKIKASLFGYDIPTLKRSTEIVNKPIQPLKFYDRDGKEEYHAQPSLFEIRYKF